MALIYAHRGASARYAEHTRAAYLQAIADGADGVECDVHLTADHQVVLLHDSTVDRTSDGTGAVAGMTLAQLRELDFSTWKGVDVPDRFGSVSQQFLTLHELIDLLLTAGHPMGLAIEFKHPDPFGDQLENETLQLLLARGWLPQSSKLGSLSISLMSFDPGAVKYLARSVPARQLCQLVSEPSVAQLSQELGLSNVVAAATATALRPAFAEGLRLLDHGEAGIAGPGIDYLRRETAAARRWLEAGRILRVWTVDEAADVEFCLDVGVQEITTNRPAEVRALL